MTRENFDKARELIKCITELKSINQVLAMGTNHDVLKTLLVLGSDLRNLIDKKIQELETELAEL